MNVAKFLLVISFFDCLSQAYRQYRQTVRNFQQEFSSPRKHFFRIPLNNYRKPISFSTVFDRNPSRYSLPLKFFDFASSSYPSRGFSPDSIFRKGEDPFGLPPFFPKVIFTPNEIDERPETEGQIREFQKDLEEQARETETDTSNLTSAFNNFTGFDGHGGTGEADLTTKSYFVSVRSKQYNYTYFF